jgi:dissimilatory sulfite reductase (desulfoviridin) alpha/beta subunit
VQCGLCVQACADDAIILEDGQPLIDRERCIDCGACVDACPKDVIFNAEKGYKVVAGGTGSRHPQLARTVAPFTDAAGVLSIVEKTVLAYRDYPQGKKEISFHAMVTQEGVGSLV